MASTRLFIGDIPSYVSVNDVRLTFSRYGTLNENECFFNTIHSKGYVFIEYRKLTDAKNAFNAAENNAGIYINGSKVRVGWARPRCGEEIISTYESGAEFPSHWPVGEYSDGKRIKVRTNEYKRLEKNFLQTIDLNVDVVSIEEICNREFYRKYNIQKEIMKCKSSATKLERELYHGTTADAVDAICVQNFDPRVNGKNATVYGRGSYFAKNAEYSHRYTDTDLKGYRYMFVVDVLVGKYALGNPDLTRPPPLDSSPTNHDLHDSCVNNRENPTIFVVFERDRSYPKYLITYKEINLKKKSYNAKPVKANASLASTNAPPVPAPVSDHVSIPLYRSSSLDSDLPEPCGGFSCVIL